MAPRWHFNKFGPTDLEIGSFVRALFSQDSGPASALVREAIQNSLDARSESSARVDVRFVIRHGPLAASASAVAPFLEGLWPHIESPDSGLEEPPHQRKAIDFLAVEDFGTHGLRGNPEEWRPQKSRDNAFYLFFRAIGQSEEQDDARGRWGVGKYVFPMASGANALFGYTVPSDAERAMLMGRIVLQTHSVGSDAFHPDGHWGLRQQHGPTLPVDDPAIIATFRRHFALKRTDEAGLSVVVPWITDEIRGDVLVEAVVREYFLAILRGDLVVTVDDNEFVTQVGPDTVESVANRIGDRLLIEQVGLARAAVTTPSSSYVTTSRTGADGAPSWDPTLLPEDTREVLERSFDAGEMISIRVPVWVRPRPQHGAEGGSFVDVFMIRTDERRSRPLVIRQGITIPDARATTTPGCASLVLIDDRLLAKLVGDSETPAHNELRHQLIKNKYVFAKSYVDLVRAVAAGILDTITKANREKDIHLLSDLFPIPDDVGHGTSPRSSRTPGARPQAPFDPPERRRASFRVDRLTDGFAVVSATELTEPPDELVLRCAYEVRRGNAFKRFDVLDFSLSNGDMQVETDGVDLVETGDNRVVARPSAVPFRIAVRGFDPNRNLVVRVHSRPARVND